VGVNQLHAGEAKIAAAGGGQGVHNVAEGVVVAEELHLHEKKSATHLDSQRSGNEKIRKRNTWPGQSKST
jgi:hypothetical protein